MSRCEVGEEGFDIPHVFLERPQGRIAVEAKQPAQALAAGLLTRTARVVVVDGEPRPARVRFPAHRADAVLPLQHGIVGIPGQAVMNHEPPVELSLFGGRVAVPFPVVAADALACLVRGASAASARDPLIRGARARTRANGDTRAQQRVAHRRLVRTQAPGDLLKGQAVIGIKPSDVRVLLQRESCFASHTENYTRRRLKLAATR